MLGRNALYATRDSRFEVRRRSGGGLAGELQSGRGDAVTGIGHGNLVTSVRGLEVLRRPVVIHLVVVEPRDQWGEKQKDRTFGEGRSLEHGRTHATLSPPSRSHVKRRRISAKRSVERIEREHHVVFSQIDVEFRGGRCDFREVHAL